MGGSGADQTEVAHCQQQVAALEAELAQMRSHLETLQQENESLRRSESRYRQIFENAPISVFLTATDGTPKEMNTAAENFLGFTIAQSQSLNWNVLAAPTLVENGTSTSSQRAIAGETVIEPPMSFDPTSTIGRGQWKWAQGHYYPIRDETGQVQEVAEIALDLTPMYEVQQRLSQERAQLLNTNTSWSVATAQVANLLLRGSIGTASQTSDYTAVLPDVVRLLGEAVGSDRCSIISRHEFSSDSGKALLTIPYCWQKAGIIDCFEATPVIFWEDFGDLWTTFSAGKVANFLVDEQPEPGRSHFKAQGCTSLLCVPILTAGECWGVIGFDNCGKPRLSDEAETAILGIAADSIAAAIERQAKDDELRKAQQALLQAEQARSQELERLNGELQQAIERLENRDRILEATATAANTLLTTPNLDTAVNTASQILGEALNTDRIAILENFDPSPDAMFPSYRGLYEWDSPQTVSQISHPVAGEGTYADIEWLYELFQQGQSASYQIEDAPEPFRSEQLDIGVKSTHLVPIYIEGRWWGVLGLDDCLEAKHRSLAELAVLRTAAACLGSAIQRDRIQKAILQAEQQRVVELASANAALQAEIIERRRAEQVSRGQTEALVRTLNTLSQEPVFDNCLGFMLQAIADQFSDRSGGIYLYSEEYDTTLLHLNYENGQIQRGKEIQHPCAHTPEPLRQWDDEYMPLLKQRQILIQDVGHYPHNIDRGIKQILVVPLLFGDTFLGNITLRSTTHRQYQPEELELAQALAHQVTLAVQLTRMAEEVRQAAIAREQEKAALERAAELTKTNEELQQREQEVQRSYRLLSVIAEVTTDLLHNSQVEEAIDQAFQRVGEAANISRVTLMQERRELSSGRLQHHVIQEWAAAGISRQMDDPVTRVMYSDEYGALVDELRAGRSIWYVIDDLPEPMQTQQINIAVKSTGAVPIFIEGEYFGCVGFDDCIDHRQWTSQEVDVLTSSAGAIGAALHRKQLVDRLVAERIQAEQERAAELAKNNQALKNSIDRLAADPDLNGFLGHVVLEIIEQLNLYTAWVELYDPTAQTLQMHLLVEGGTLQLKPNLPDRGYLTQCYPAQHNAAWNHLLQTKQPLVITLDTLPQFFTGDDLEMQVRWAQQCGIQCGINLLLLLGDEPLGILILFSTDRTAFSREELELAQALVQQATLAIQLTRLAEGAKQAAILEERNRMARELHDSLAQSLTGVVMQLNAATEFLTVQPDQTQTCITRAQELAKQGLAEARRSVWLLYDNHLAAGDLSSALKKLVEQTSLTTNTTITLEISGVSRLLEAPICLHLLRIAQESLTNALRHAHPQTVHLHLTYLESQIHLQICDDGCGFHLEQSRGKGFGLTGMSDRAKAIGAQLQIQSKLGTGTQTIVTVAIASP